MRIFDQPNLLKNEEKRYIDYLLTYRVQGEVHGRVADALQEATHHHERQAGRQRHHQRQHAGCQHRHAEAHPRFATVPVSGRFKCTSV